MAEVILDRIRFFNILKNADQRFVDYRNRDLYSLQREPLFLSYMRNTPQILIFLLSLLIGTNSLRGQNPNASAGKPGPDILLFKNGEKLLGQLQSATGTAVTFKSEMAGVVTVEWSKVQELQTSERFAVVPKGVTLRRADETAKVAKGPLTVKDDKVEINSGQGAPQQMPVADLSNVVNASAFDNAFRRQSFLSGWKGGATLGIALTEATQKNQTISSALNLVRAVPAESWLNLRSRTTIEFNQAYGKLTQPNVPSVKTDLIHAGAEQDWYLNPRLFAFGRAMFDHSFSQGLDLQQNYGGGIGVVLIKGVNQELDFKAGLDYINQRFQDSRLNQQLFGSSFSETYTKTFAHNILFNEQAGITPAWNNTDAYSAFASAALTFPVYHHFGLTIGAIDNFLNNPPPTFKKNSFQLTVGATYNF
jgi:putative salt-induced outer membrane protein YdiY